MKWTVMDTAPKNSAGAPFGPTIMVWGKVGATYAAYPAYWAFDIGRPDGGWRVLIDCPRWVEDPRAWCAMEEPGE